MILADLSLNLPLLSAVFLLIAGVLVGYAIASPLRTSTDSVAGELRAMREQNEDLETALQQQRDAYARLERRDRERNQEWMDLQASARRMEKILSERQSEDAGAIALQEQSEAALNDLVKEREKCATLEARCKSQATSLADLKRAADDYRDLQAKYNVLQEELVQKKELLRHAEDRLKKTESQMRQRDENFRNVADEKAGFAAEKVQLSEKIVNLETVVSKQATRLDQSDAARQAALEQLETERGQRLAAEAELETKDRQLRDVTRDAALVEERDQEIAELRRQVQQFNAVADERAASVEETTAFVAALEAERGQLVQEIDSHRRAFDTVARQRDEVRSAHEAMALRLNSAEQALASAQAEAGQAMELQQEKEHLRSQLHSAQVEMQALTHKLREACIERDSAQAQSGATQNAIDEVREELRQASVNHDRLRAQRDENLEALRKEEKRRLEAATALDEQTSRIGSLSDQIRQIEPLREELTSVRRQLSLREQQLEGLRGQAELIESQKAEISELRESLQTAVRNATVASDQAQDAKQSYEQQQSLLTQYRNERDRALAELRSLKVAASHRAHEASSGVSRPQTTPATSSEVHPTRGLIYHAAPESSDDLKLISGIATVLESRLNDLGIYTYHQIMQWNSEQVEEFSKLLSFPDRIDRDDWVGQAAALHRKAQSQAA